MRKPFLLLAALLFALPLFSITAQAQLAVYGEVTGERYGGTGTYATANQPQQFTVNPTGFTGGVLLDGIRTYGRFTLGVDARAVILSTRRGANGFVGQGTHVQSYLGGIRGVVRTPKPWLKPYLQFSAGLGKTDVNGQGSLTSAPYVYSNNFEYHIYAGTDVSLASFLAFRVFEVGYGQITGSGGTSLLSISTGLVVHFPPKQ